MTDVMSQAGLERIELSVADGTVMTAYAARADGRNGRPGGLLVLQEAYGVTAFLRTVVARFAALGITAVAPELYHRTASGPFSYEDTKLETVRPHIQAMRREQMLADARAAYAWLAESEGIPTERIAALGFCMGGGLAYLANAHLPLAAAVSFYGGGISRDLLDLAGRQHGPALFFWGGRDSHITTGERRAVADALTAAGCIHEQVVFSQAQHGFFCDERPWCYDAGASLQAWSVTLEFLRQANVLHEVKS